VLTQQAIALNRFGLGARPDDPPPTDPKRWLNAQFDSYEVRPAAIAGLPDARAATVEYTLALRQLAAEKRAGGGGATPMEPGDGQMTVRGAAPLPATPGDAGPAAGRKSNAPADNPSRVLASGLRDLYRQSVAARAASALTTPAPFLERLVWFWSNHFALSIDKVPVVALAGDYEATAIRPHVLGRFEDMLVAAEQHPAMLIYLDQAQSIGPDSPAAELLAARPNGKVRGLNENLGREIMELHTIGVRSGYSQADVTEFARALTGWSVTGIGGGPGARFGQGAARLGQGDDEPGSFTFRGRLHEPGVRTIMGRRYDQPGEDQARAVLADLAASPATATHIATKLARHFAGDVPPPAMVARLSHAFLSSRGDLPTVYRALINSPEAWAPQPAKFKTPWEWTVSALRGSGRTSLAGLQIAPMVTQLGQPVWKPGSPAGYDDIAASWAAPDALLRRVELAQRIAGQIGDKADPRALAARLMPGSVGSATELAIGNAESVPTALALLFVSPEFQRR
jgi:uncharacterized protein (DUF1800 family)